MCERVLTCVHIVNLVGIGRDAVSNDELTHLIYVVVVDHRSEHGLKGGSEEVGRCEK